MKVSISIPTYNQSRYVRQAVESALSQEYSDLEVIVGDDCSSDDTMGVLEPLLSNKKLRYEKNEKNLGRVRNYRKLLCEHATGDLFLNLDGDDYFTDSTYVARAVKLLEDNPQMVLVFARKKTLFESTGRAVEDRINEKLPQVLDGDRLFLDYPGGISIPHMTTLYRRGAAMDLGYYTEDIMSSDWESVLRLIQGQKVGFLNRTVGVWRKHLENASRSFDVEAIEKNTAFIESPFGYAMRRGAISKTRLRAWRRKMLVRYYVKHLVKMEFQSSPKASRLKGRILSRHPDVFLQTVLNPFLLAVKAFSWNDSALEFLFRDVLKMESMLFDFRDMADD